MNLLFTIITTLLLSVGYANAGNKHEFSGKAFNINTNAEPVTIIDLSLALWAIPTMSFLPIKLTVCSPAI